MRFPITGTHGDAWREVTLALAIGLVALVAAYPGRGGVIARWPDALMLALYAFCVMEMARAWRCAD